MSCVNVCFVVIRLNANINVNDDLGVVHSYQHFHKHTKRTLRGRGCIAMFTFLDIINVERTFHYETHFVKNLITTTNYKNRTRNFNDCFLRMKFFYYKINLFLLYTLGMGGGGHEKCTFCTLVTMLINVNIPLQILPV